MNARSTHLQGKKQENGTRILLLFPSVGRTRQSLLYIRSSATLGKELVDKEYFVECHVAALGKTFANQHSTKLTATIIWRFLCRVPTTWHSAKHSRPGGP